MLTSCSGRAHSQTRVLFLRTPQNGWVATRFPRGTNSQNATSQVVLCWALFYMVSEEIYGCGSKLSRRGKPQVLVHISYQGAILVRVFEPQTYNTHPLHIEGGMFIKQSPSHSHGSKPRTPSEHPDPHYNRFTQSNQNGIDTKTVLTATANWQLLSPTPFLRALDRRLDARKAKKHKLR